MKDFIKSNQILVGIVLLGILLSSSIVFVRIDERNQKENEIRAKEQQIIAEQNYEAQKAVEKRIDLEVCESEAVEAYWSFMKINGTEKEDGTIYAQNSFWDRAEENKKEAMDICFKKYK
jgi:hypothetical protein